MRMVGLGFSLWWAAAAMQLYMPATRSMLHQSRLNAQSKQAFDFYRPGNLVFASWSEQGAAAACRTLC